MAGELDGIKVAILATEMFEQDELFKPMQALQEAGARVSVIAPEDGEIQGALGDTESGKSVKVDNTLDTASPNDFDAVMLPGGAVNSDHLRVNEDAQAFVQMIDGAGKPIAAICHAPWLLVSAELVRGRTLTSFHTLKDDIENAGGTWVDEEVCEDRNWITSRNPDDIPAFIEAMTVLFATARR